MDSISNFLPVWEWRWYHVAIFASVILGGLEILATLIPLVMDRVPGLGRIPIRGKHHDELDALDLSFIAFNKITTVVFVYHVIQFCWTSDRVLWDLKEANFVNTFVAVVLLYVVYDFFYTLFHRFLHIRSVYPLIHKHHHRQKAPTRGNLDGINVHPFEFSCGEYLHLGALYLVSQFVLPALYTTFASLAGSTGATNAAESSSAKVHIASVAIFIVMGGVLASLNHTRYDVDVYLVPSFLRGKDTGKASETNSTTSTSSSSNEGSFLSNLSRAFIYSAKVHDVHHRLPESNYGQYIMLWDYLMGSYRPFVYPQNKGKGASPSSSPVAPWKSINTMKID